MDFQTILSLCFGLSDDLSPADFIRKTVAAFETFYAERAIPTTPFLALRTADVIAAWAHIRAVETQLSQQGLVIAPDAESHRKKPFVNPLVALAPRAWDRLRKAVRELERHTPLGEEARSDRVVPAAAPPKPARGAALRPASVPTAPSDSAAPVHGTTGPAAKGSGVVASTAQAAAGLSSPAPVAAGTSAEPTMSRPLGALSPGIAAERCAHRTPTRREIIGAAIHDIRLPA